MKYKPFMVQFREEVLEYCEARGIKPTTLMRYAIDSRYHEWRDWMAGTVRPSVDRLEQVREYMIANPPETKRRPRGVSA